jgi:hypothetical protein
MIISTDVKPAFYQMSRQWWRNNKTPLSDNAVDEVVFGLYDANGDANGQEIAVTWYQSTANDKHSYSMLEVSSSNWKLFFQFMDLTAKMAEIDHNKLTPDEFCDILKSCGFEDITKTEIP